MERTNSQDYTTIELLRQEKEEREKSVSIPDLDVFLNQIYAYYVGKGFFCLVVSQILSNITVAFTIFFSAFMLLFVDWSVIYGCSLNNFACDSAQMLNSNTFRYSWAYLAFVALYLALFSLYLLLGIARMFVDLKTLSATRHFFNVTLGISEQELQTAEWPDVVEQIVLSQEHFVISGATADITPLSIMQRIMRRDNYFIALMNKDLLGVKVPLLSASPILTEVLQWNLDTCIFAHLFDSTYSLSLNDALAVKRRLRFFAIANFLLSPFILVFMLIHWMLSNAERFHRDPSYLGARQWSLYAKWRFREFNELPHLFEKRVNASTTLAEKYVRQFPSQLASVVARFLSFVLSAVIGTLCLMGFVNEASLSVTIFHRNLWWYLAITGAVLAVVRSFVISKATVFEPASALEDVIQFTHFVPKRWRRKGHTHKVYVEFCALFQNSLVLFCQEILSVLFVPYLLWSPFYDRADDIVHFVRQFTVREEGLGDICGFSTFDFEKYGNAKFGAPVHCDKRDRSRQGKMEKSYLNYRVTYGDTSHPQRHDSTGSAEDVQSGRLSVFHMDDYIHCGSEPHQMHNSGVGTLSRQLSGEVSVLRVSQHTDLTASIPSSVRDADLQKYMFWLDKYYETRLDAARTDFVHEDA